jgi:predicted 2-oxoglutarate/Fe(II)-dependent dioxygenase YbiX
MPSTKVFRSLGLFLAEDFLAATECLEYCAAIARSPFELGEVRTQGSVEQVDVARRAVQIAAVPPALKSQLKVRLCEIQRRLEEHFGVALQDCENPQLLTYGAGNFHVPHTDGTDDPAAPEYMKRRRVSVVVFLNAASANADSSGYKGGALTFYGLIKEPAFASCGLPLDARSGMLVAFPSSVVHEVGVTRGQRHTIATWFA